MRRSHRFHLRIPIPSDPRLSGVAFLKVLILYYCSWLLVAQCGRTVPYQHARMPWLMHLSGSICTKYFDTHNFRSKIYLTRLDSIIVSNAVRDFAVSFILFISLDFYCWMSLKKFQVVVDCCHKYNKNNIINIDRNNNNQQVNTDDGKTFI